MGSINRQQADLDLDIKEYPLIDDLKVQIKPFEELWNLQALFDARIKEWEQGKLDALVPDEVEADFRKMFSTSSKLSTRFEGAKQQRPAGVAAMMNRKLTDFRPYQRIIRALCNPGL